jgi:hypothetical protein
MKTLIFQGRNDLRLSPLFEKEKNMKFIVIKFTDYVKI